MMELKKLNTDEPEWEDQVLLYGLQTYRDKVEPRLNAEHDGRTVLVDLNTGKFLFTRNLGPGIRRLKRRVPNPLIWAGRISLAREMGLQEVWLPEQPKRDFVREQRPY